MKDRLIAAHDLLSSFLLDNTADDEGFDSIPEVDDARSILQELIEEVQTFQDSREWMHVESYRQQIIDGDTIASLTNQNSDDWIRADKRLPTKEDADYWLDVWVHGYDSKGNPAIKLEDYRGVQYDPQYSVYWKRTNLQPILKNQEKSNG